jgi:pimeloyl-ACP methyl ester carboxylesterase
VAPAPIILVPGFWLGAWAWDDVAPALRAGGHDVIALTLPGLESADADRSSVTFEDHVAAIVDAVKASSAPVVLAVHSGAGASGYAASDRVPEHIAEMVYVDSGPAAAALDPGFEGDEFPLPAWEDLDENLDGISQQQLDAFRKRAVPEPAGAMREGAMLSNDARLDIPTTAICTAFSSKQYKQAVEEGQTWLGGYADLRNVRWIDLPTSHWPMWSRPRELAATIDEIAKSVASH